MAERYYLKRYASDFIASQSSKGLQDFLQIHPRIHQLISGYYEVILGGWRLRTFFFDLMQSMVCQRERVRFQMGKEVMGSTLLVSASLKEALICILFDKWIQFPCYLILILFADVLSCLCLDKCLINHLQSLYFIEHLIALKDN